MTRIAIATDTTAGMPASLVEKHHIHTIPLNLMFGEEVYLDAVEIDPETFYSRLATIKEGKLPTTSQPSAGAFKAFFEKIATEADEIISIHISSALSGTVDSALQARDMLPGIPIHVIDSRLTSLALAYLVLEAVRMAEAGSASKEIVAHVEAIIPVMNVFFAVDTMRYLHMGGRIGGGAAFLGTALDIKPILELRGGKIEAAAKARSMKRAMPKLVTMLEDRLGKGSRIRAASIGAQNPECAQILARLLQEHFDCVELHIGDLSPVIGAHVGPGTVGVLAYPVS